MRVFLAIVQTGIAAAQWHWVMVFAEMERDYSPEVKAAAHFHQPWGLKAFAIVMTAAAASCWFAAWRSADRS
jgi:hypothetical protein